MKPTFINFGTINQQHSYPKKQNHQKSTSSFRIVTDALKQVVGIFWDDPFRNHYRARKPAVNAMKPSLMACKKEDAPNSYRVLRLYFSYQKTRAEVLCPGGGGGGSFCLFKRHCAIFCRESQRPTHANKLMCQLRVVSAVDTARKKFCQVDHFCAGLKRLSGWMKFFPCTTRHLHDGSWSCLPKWRWWYWTSSLRWPSRAVACGLFDRWSGSGLVVNDVFLAMTAAKWFHSCHLSDPTDMNSPGWWQQPERPRTIKPSNDH